MALDRRPFALIGSWAGGGALIGSEPVIEAGFGDDPFSVLDDLPAASSHDVVVGGGWFGYLGYHLGRRLECLPAGPSRATPLPDAAWAFYDHLLRFDGSDGRWWFEALWIEARATALERRYRTLQERLRRPAPRPQLSAPLMFVPVPSPLAHAEAVRRCVEHIRAGDVFQVNVCMRLESRTDEEPLATFCQAVRSLRPAYGAYLAGEDGHVLSLSPELFMRRRGRHVTTTPIKGTAPRPADELEAAHHRRQLVASQKDRAENVMIVDLMRNDLGRVCEIGSVTVPELVSVEAHPGVWHLVSRVEGRLRAEVGDADLLRATFPPGSVTGAPKIRAMELIADLETAPREVYTGAIGYVSPVAGLELSVAIRTFEVAQGRIWLGVGGGVTADSQPGAELAECAVKAAPLLRAVRGRCVW
jgi:para-aminobenzoate synthetase / 4-amino-4-deoxychorismate lyase